jgi:hypothetical protein
MVWVAGHFGEWVQGIGGPSGEVALVTLACPIKGADVTWQDAPDLRVEDASGLLDAGRAATMLAALGVVLRGRISVAPDLSPGGGAGMSTAALVALARAVGASEDRIAQACLAAEGAVDPLMLDRPDAVVWAPRAAKVLTALPPPPAATIIGGFWGPPERTDANDMRFPPVGDLIAQWTLGPDLPAAAAIATASAERTTALRGPSGDPTAALATRLGALGWARSHTGPARALVFSPDDVPTGAEAALTQAGFTDVFSFKTGGRP